MVVVEEEDDMVDDCSVCVCVYAVVQSTVMDCNKNYDCFVDERLFVVYSRAKRERNDGRKVSERMDD